MLNYDGNNGIENYLSDWQIRCSFERVKEILRHGVLVGKVLEELADARFEIRGAHEVFHHSEISCIAFQFNECMIRRAPYDGAALAVRDGVEHRVDLVRRVDVHHDGSTRNGGVCVTMCSESLAEHIKNGNKRCLPT